jgi:hypothetical protein
LQKQKGFRWACERRVPEQFSGNVLLKTVHFSNIMENREDVISYIKGKCESIVHLVLKMKIPLEELIPSVKRHLEEVAKSDEENTEISIGLYKDVSSFIKGKENKLLRHIINKHPRYRVLELKQKLETTKRKLETTKRKLEKTEDDNRTLGESNRVLKRQKTKLEDRWTRAHFMRMDMLAENASLGARQKVLAQELRVFKEGVLQEQRDANARLAAENIGLKKALEAAKTNRHEILEDHPGLTCPITLNRFKEAVYASDGHTYEKDALDQWIRQGGKSPLTRDPIRIIGPNRALQDAIAALTPSP